MLCIHLPYFRGYLHDRERAELITIDGKPYFKTGDCTSLDPAGNYTILGRMDDMVKINGNRIEPSEVESAIKKVLPRPDESALFAPMPRLETSFRGGSARPLRMRLR